MKFLVKLSFLFLLFVFPWDAQGMKGVSASYQDALIEAESPRDAYHQLSGKISPIATHKKTEKDVNKSNRSSFLDILIDSRDDLSESISFEAFVPRYASIFPQNLSTIEHCIPTDKLIFPFHFFL